MRRADQTIIRGQEDFDLSGFRARTVQGVEFRESESSQVTSPGSDRIIHCDHLFDKRKQLLSVCPAVGIWISRKLRFEHDAPGPHIGLDRRKSDQCFDCFGLSKDSLLAVVIRQSIHTTGVEVDSHLRGSASSTGLSCIFPEIPTSLLATSIAAASQSTNFAPARAGDVMISGLSNLHGIRDPRQHEEARKVR